MSLLKVDQDKQTVSVDKFEINNQIVYNYFQRLPAHDRDEYFTKAMYIGVLALMEDRISAFLSKVNNELGTEMESLKIMFDFKKELFYRTSVKGLIAEDDVAEYLASFVEKHKLKDKVSLSGTAAGRMKRNKTGDIICNINNTEDVKVIVECKFDKSIQFGHIRDKDVFNKTARKDTAWSQLLEAAANRDGKISVIVLDRMLTNNNILEAVENVRYIPEVGMVAIIDSQRGDYNNLGIAYTLCRDIALNATADKMDHDTLSIIMNRVLRDVTDTQTIRELVLSNIDNNKKILGQLEKSMLSMEFTQRFLTKFLKHGYLNKEELFEFYQGQEIKDKFRLVEKELSDK